MADCSYHLIVVLFESLEENIRNKSKKLEAILHLIISKTIIRINNSSTNESNDKVYYQKESRKIVKHGMRRIRSLLVEYKLGFIDLLQF